MRKPITVLTLAVLTSVGITACEPPPPRLALSVATTALGADDVPGDGVCAAAAAGGQCTLQAAIEEGNTALDGAEVTVPGGTYAAFDAQVTGDIAINRGAAGVLRIDDQAEISVAASAKLRIDGLETYWSNFVVDGNLQLHRSDVGGTTAVAVNPGGAAVLTTSIVGGFAGIDNHGTVAIVDSLVIGNPALATASSGTTHVARSLLVGDSEDDPTCTGDPAFVSHGYVHTDVPCDSIPGTGDSTGDPLFGGDVGFEPESPLVDAIPVGAPGCDDPAAVDLYGNPRGVDGNGDGIAGCDIGPFERQPSP